MTATPAAASPPDPLVPGSVEAQLLARVWEGNRVTVVSSPPGGGKSTLIGWLSKQLLERTDLTFRVAAPTRNAAQVLQRKIALEAGPDHHVRLDMRGAGIVATRPHDGQTDRLSVSTIARLSTRPPAKYDVLIVDEAFQTKFSELAIAASTAEQIVLIGDPGQIGPVVRSDTAAFSDDDGPHVRGPEVFLREPETVTMSLPTTYRLGVTTRDVIEEFYDFDFDSGRPDRHVTDRRGRVLPEISHRRISPVASVQDATHLSEIVETVRELVGGELTQDTWEGQQVRTITAADVCVVTSHNAQCDRLTAIMSTIPALADVKTGTADRLQGGEWPIVVAVDPLIGHRSAGAHQLSPGRLCVMLSRHSVAMVWLHDGLPGRLETLADTDTDAKLGLRVRGKLLAQPDFPSLPHL